MDNNVVDLILQDHDEMRRLIQEVRDQPDRRAGVVPLLTTLITAHERAEESRVYPAARRELDADDLVEHSQQEHLLADSLLRDLADQAPGGNGYEQTLDKLMEALTHHMEEEESDVLPRIRDGLSTERLGTLGQEFLDEREQHLGEQAGDITKRQLEQQAANLGMSVGDRSKSELADALEDQADE